MTRGREPSAGPPRERALGPKDPDEVLVVRALDGDRWAREVLFRRHVDPVTRLVTRLVGRRADADDVAQDAFAEALRDLPRLHEPSAFGPWLRRIAVNRARKRWRRNRLTRALGLDRGMDDATLERLARDDTSAETRAELARIDAVLARAGANERVAWMLRRVEGATLPEVAALAGCSLATAKRRIARVDALIDAHVKGGPDA